MTPATPFEIYVAEVTVEDHPQAPVNGRSVYVVVEETEKTVTLLHPWTLSIFDMPLQTFIRSVGLTYWPESLRTAPSYEKFNMANVIKKMYELLQDYAERGKQHPANSVRKILATLQGIPLEQIPQYKESKPMRERTATVQKERGPRKPGVIDAIKVELDAGFTVDEMVAKLAVLFPEREADGMRNTVKCQLARLPKNVNKPILKNEVAGRGLVFQWGGQ